MSIIEHLHQLEVIKTNWYLEDGNDSIAGVVARNTHLKRVILSKDFVLDYSRHECIFIVGNQNQNPLKKSLFYAAKIIYKC